MNVVFLNRLTRLEGRLEEVGQVFIGEEHGTWTAGWRQTESASEPTSEQVEQIWYEGVSWEELLAAFRHGVAGKMVAGFRPMLDGLLEDAPFWERKPSMPSMLHFYAEQQPETELTAKLKEWRRKKAQEKGIVAYLIATNRELHLLEVYRPQTAGELAQLPGFGKLKIDRYSAELTGLLKDEPRDHAYPLDWVADRVDTDALYVWMFRDREEKYGRALASVKEKKAILAGIRDGVTLEELEKRLQCPRRKLVERLERLDEDGYDVMPLIERELLTLPEEEWNHAQGAMVKLGDRYLKPLLKEIYGEMPTVETDQLERHYEKLRMMRIRYRKERKQVV